MTLHEAIRRGLRRSNPGRAVGDYFQTELSKTVCSVLGTALLGVHGGRASDIALDPVPALDRLYAEVPALKKIVPCPLCGKKARLDTIAELHLNDGVCFGPKQQPWRVKRIGLWAMQAEPYAEEDRTVKRGKGREAA